MTTDEKTVHLALDRYSERLARLPNVVGLGIGQRTPEGGGVPDLCLAVYVSRKVPSQELGADEIVPATLEVEHEQVRTHVIEVGPFQKEGGGRGSQGFTKEGG